MARSAVRHVAAARALRSALLVGTSIAAVAFALGSSPANAQLAGMRAALGVPANLGTQTPASTNTVTAVTPTMSQILVRHHAYEARVQQAAGLIAQANAAARAAASAAAHAVPDGLHKGGLDPVSIVLTSAQDPTGLSVWEGAAKPTETQTGAAVDVTVKQTQSRALLSWNSFNVGAHTTLTFDQQGNADWVAVNRVVGEIDPATGLTDPTHEPSPTQILGSIKADGTVYVLNRAGVMFGANSQVNLHSLLASSLELGSANIPAAGGTLHALSLQERNNNFLARGLLPDAVSGLVSAVAGEQHGAVIVGQGAQINANGGYIILAGPKVSSAGEIKASVGGQVSLEAGTQVDATISSGAADSPDPFVRGLILTSLGGGSLDVTGSIAAPQGYISLGTDLLGTITMAGVLTSTTSVARNGKISLIGGTIDIADGAAMAITPDTSDATIPQSADSVATFKTSQIDIGSHLYSLVGGRIGTGTDSRTFDLLPASITLGIGSTIEAPSANVSIGGRAGDPTRTIDQVAGLVDAKVEVQDNAVIDVSGVADYLLPASRNMLEISPAKRNELRDTPTYRDPTTDGSFTLNGATLFVDPRISGVRADGVAWIGSPLIEAGSLAAQIGVTAPELMTKGGNVTLATLGLTTQPVDGEIVPTISLASNAIIDFSGGWVRYSAGSVHYSQLLTPDGRVIDISKADPNDAYIAIGSGFVEQLPQLSDPTVYANLLLQGTQFQQSYVEGRDAGSLTIKAPTGSFNAELHGDAVAGQRQIAAGLAPTKVSTLAGDIRKLQQVGNQLPSSGLLHIQSIPGGDMVVGAAPAGASPGTMQIDAATLNSAHLGAVSLQTSGQVTIGATTDLQLAAGGALNIDAGRTITFDGDVSAPGGSITARTYGVLLGDIFDASDDLPLDGQLTGDVAPELFDIVVNDGSVLSTRGRWVNDLLVTDGLFDGPGYTSGGSISFTSAPHVAAYKADGTGAVDLSGSILLKSGSLLDVSGGGYVAPSGVLSLDGKGGNVSLINETSYFQKEAAPSTESSVITGAGLFRSDLTTFQLSGDPTHVSAIVPDAINSTVTIDGNIRAFGFKGGGVFTLVTPDLKFGSSDGVGTYVPLDFLAQTGFGTLSLSAWNTAFLPNVFNNGLTGSTAILATDKVQIRAGETLNLTQSILPSVLGSDQLNLLQTQKSGTDISLLPTFAPTNQLGDYDNLPANLILGGLTELEVLGGTITGAPKASITAPLIYNAGTIRIAGGSVLQKLTLPISYIDSAISRAALGIDQLRDSDGIDRGAGLSVIFGTPDASGLYDENALNAAGITDSNGNVLSNRDLLALTGQDRQIYYLGLLDPGQGIVLAPNSVTDLSGISVRNPRASFLPGTTTPLATGRLINGGTIKAAGLFVPQSGFSLLTPPGFSASPYTFFNGAGVFQPNGAIPALTITAGDNAVIDLSGAADMFDIQTGPGSFAKTLVWSNAGVLSALGGGDVTQASIDAHGGAPQARGGTLEWLDPVLVQTAATASGVVSADQIEAAGFDSFIARGDVTTVGDVDLTLARSFLLRARDYSGAPLSTVANSSGDTKPFADPYYAISFGATGALSITAAHIGLLGIDQQFDSLADVGVGSLALHGGSIDIFGAVAFRNSLTDVLLDSTGDIRLIGVQPLAMTLTPDTATDAPSLSGQVIAGGNLTFRAAQVYATTGSGNLQRLIETNGAEIARPFLIASAGADATIRFERRRSATPPIPYSAGSYLAIQAPHIEQAGVLRAPLGRIDLGSTTPLMQGSAAGLFTTFGATQTVTLESGSLTSVSAGDLRIPYGTTTDLTEFFFAPGSSAPLTAPPAAELRFGGDAIAILDGATVDASGGTGDVYAYEFISGTGGSRDVLSRFNSDAFSGNNGFQYADGRQVYAIVPVGSSSAALYDPIYSADYGALYSIDVGQTVHLDGADGVPAGDYVLLPAQYAMLPGALRLVENVGSAPPLPGESAVERDGSIVVGGTYATAGTDSSDWQRRSFTVQSQDTFRQYSRIELTSATKDFTDLANRNGTVTPRLPADAARIVFNPLSSLLINGTFETDPAKGGRGSEVDIAAEVIDVVSSMSGARDGALTLVAGDLDRLNAASLFIGGIRTDLADGSTDLDITAHEINILNDAAHPLRAPEILIAVDGLDSSLVVADGASIVATGTLTDTRSGDYNVASFTKDQFGNLISDNSGAGAVLRLANGTERLINRSGDLADSVTKKNVIYTIGRANLVGDALAIDTSRNLTFDPGATLDVNKIAISGDDVSFSSDQSLLGLIITPELERAFAVADSLTVRANSAIGFTGGTHDFNDLSLYAPGIRLIRAAADIPTDPLTVTLNADNVTIGNFGRDRGACTVSGALSCGDAGSAFVLNASTLTFGSGTFHTYGFDGSVALNASGGAYYSGVGAFDVGGADLDLITPFVVDRGNGTQPDANSVSPDLALRTSGSVTIAAGSNSAIPTGAGSPGARLAIGSLTAPAQSITVDGSLLRATAGTIELYSASGVSVIGAAQLEAPSYAQVFGDAADPITVSANGGTISLVALNGDITLGDAARLSIGGATGSSGTLNLFATDGQIDLAGTVDAAAPDQGASLNYDSGLSAFNLSDFLLGWGADFTGEIAIRTGVGDLTLAAGETLLADSVRLTADGGSTIIGGTINTSGLTGGDIALFARDAVGLLSTAVLDAHADGYEESDTRRASGGDVTLGVGDSGAINVASGATIDVRALRPGDRLVGETRTDPRTLNQITAYTYVEGDQGGTLTLRAPVIDQTGSDTVDIDFAGSVTGARDVSIEGYRRYDLAAIAADPSFTGVTIDPITGLAELDLAAVTPGKENFLADLGPGTLVDFIQNFDIAAARSKLGMLPTLAVYHERPNVELDYAGDIALTSNWNLGAGTVDIAGALVAGDMRLSALGNYADGSPRYEVVPGREADLFERFVNLTYRVGGAIDGEAGVLTLRAGGDLNIEHSISDGFFAFSDQTDPAYISSQLGGGLHAFNPAINVQCGGASTGCTEVLPFDLFNGVVPAGSAINFNLTGIVNGTGTLAGTAPYSAAANGPAALGLYPGGAGDPIGSAQIFPLLADGTPVDAFSIQLVGGAGASASANPLHVDRATGGNVVVSGETDYAIQAVNAAGQYSGPLQLRYKAIGAPNQFISGDFFNSLVELTGLDADTLGASTSRVLFGQVSPTATAFVRQAAVSFFAAYPDQVLFIGPAGNPIGFNAPLDLVIRFLQSRDASGLTFTERLGAQINNGTLGLPAALPAPIINPPGDLARVRTVVRTGVGSIDVAAAGDIDLRNGATPQYLGANAHLSSARSSNAAQAGGAAIYTAGHLVMPTAVTARVSGTQELLTIDPSNYVVTTTVGDPNWVPTSAGRLQIQPAYLTGGGSLSLTAGNDILGRRDVWSEAFNSNNPSAFFVGGVDHFPAGVDIVGSSDQRWRVGSIGIDDAGGAEFDTNIRINSQLFSSGVGTLGGGDIAIDAGRDVRELTVALDTSVTTGEVGDSFGSMVFGGGNLDLTAGHDILGGRFDISSGVATITAGRNIASAGKVILRPLRDNVVKDLLVDNLTEVRLTDATVAITAGGSVTLGKVSALGVDSTDGDGIDYQIDANALGYYTGRSGISVEASGDVSIAGDTTRFYVVDLLKAGTYRGSIMPASLEVTSFDGDIDLGTAPLLMYPGAKGQLSLLAGGTLAPVTIDLDDGDASLMPGIFSALNFNTTENLLFGGRPFGLPVIRPGTTDVVKRLYHAQTPLHAADDLPIRIAVGGDLVDTTLFAAKSARISAGGDIVNMMFSGQNLGQDDVTRIVAGRDITATVAGATSSFPDQQAILGRSIFQGNQFILGGPGALYVEAGRNLGPFLGSATIIDDRSGVPVRGSYPGGILSVGDDFNPWLPAKSADIYAFFGVGKGMDFAALRETYVNPANVGALDGDLFVQISDPFGNKSPDRSKPIYAPILIAWMQANQADALVAAFGTTNITADQAYSTFASLPELVQRSFLLENVYFNELAAPSRPDSPSYLQYVRGYRAVDALFPAALGYTANDLSGSANGGTRVSTGNLDLRLATIQTTRGADITILGPGGEAILGSVVRTSAQAARRAYQPAIVEGFDINNGTFRPAPTGGYTVPVVDIPIGFEGVLTLRGGAIRGFTDGDVRLNQSRLFAQQGGDIVLWSSNGDLNAGQGPKNAANVPPIVVRVDPNGFAEVDSAGAVTGAGIAGFTAIRRRNPLTGEYELVDPLNDSDLLEAQRLLAAQPSGTEVQVAGKIYRRDAPTITLIAPVGTVDAGDAGVRAGGDIFVAAAQVANADNVKVGGSSVGIPSAGGATAPPTPANAASAITANLFKAVNPNSFGEQKVRILVDVLGFYGGGGDDTCPPDSTDPNCKTAN